MAKSIECKCESNFTCGYCLRNAKPWHFTCDNGTVIPAVPVDLQKPALNTYDVNARMLPIERVQAATSWEARKAYAERHGVPVHEVIARRVNIPESWRKHIQ